VKTPEEINGRTPEQIKKALVCTSFGATPKCYECPYCTEEDGENDDDEKQLVYRCGENIGDVLEYMSQLEADREALLKIAHDYAGCSECVHVDNKPELPPCRDCGVLGKNWVWRGAGKEQTNENA
jgi:hypothetical protein